ncbi:MAG: hypothetical protein ACJ79R_23540 [Anaeromyxobacteraceae bacterium]
MIRVTREQLVEWRLALSWNDGAGLEPSDVEQLLEEIERLQGEVEQLRRRTRADRTPWSTAQ